MCTAILICIVMSTIHIIYLYKWVDIDQVKVEDQEQQATGSEQATWRE